MKLRLSGIALIIILSATSLASAQSKADKLDMLMKSYHELGQFNGSVLVAEEGQKIYENGFGYANVEWKVENKPDTKFMLGSLSKQFTAMLVLQLIEKGKVRFEGTISDYLPYYPEETGKRITIHQLLNHTSGIPDVMNLPDFDQKHAHTFFTTKELLKLFDSLALDFEPGTRFSYSNSGYNVLAAVIEEVTGKSYGQVLKENITEPLGMNHTGYSPGIEVVTGLAEGYRWAPLSDYIHPVYFDNSISKGSGGIHSTVRDLLKWDQALYSTKLISDSLKTRMMSPNDSGYGYGFWINEWVNPTNQDTLTFVEHGGANAGFHTMILRSVKDKNTIILLCNTNEAPLNFIKYRIRSILYDRPYDLPEQNLKNIVAEVLKEKGITAAEERYLELKKEKLGLYGDWEFLYEFSQLGYSLVLSNHMKEAKAIYKMNVSSFPNYAKVYDDLAEAYMFEGKNELAIKYYKKALDLEPDNERILRMVRKLNGDSH